MGKPPAMVIITRHGARLDAADKEWHLSSPTPYDPPLTYGGWLQSQSLGRRIGSIVHTTHESAERASSPSTITGEEGLLHEPVNLHTLPKPNNDNNQKRAYKVIIHSSPFLRCIQTSIAIGAGITQHEGSIGRGGQTSRPRHHPLRSEAQHPVQPASPYLKGLENSTVPQLAAIPEPELDNILTGQSQRPVEQAKPCLRVDAFLGEWLSPEYFDMITPPPNSVMMVTSAKAELMKQGEYVDVPAGSHRHLPDKGKSSGLWGSGSSTVTDTMNRDGSGPLSSISTIGATLPRYNRASSHSNVHRSSLDDNNRITPRSVSKIETSTMPRSLSYDPPTPSYAISPLEPIPPGYVAHARDACTAVDLQWDSMRQPHDWGNGGEYGEEWSGMHKRFRRGLESMVTWYKHNDAGLTTRNIIDGTSSELANDGTDVVLILVTHGAGCNALLGALTNQPVLLDVGMASLTLAVRKESSKGQVPSSISPDGNSGRRSSIGTNVSNEYEVKITASTDHLHARGRSSTAGVPHYSPSLTSSPTSYHRYRTNSAASTASSSSFTDGNLSVEPDNRVMSSMGSGEGPSRTMSFSGGLWSKPATRNLDWHVDRLHSEKTLLPNGHSPLAKEVSSNGKLNEDETSIIKRDDKVGRDHRSLGQPSAQKGLWGALPASTINEREKGIKRRWTHSEQR